MVMNKILTIVPTRKGVLMDSVEAAIVDALQKGVRVDLNNPRAITVTIYNWVDSDQQKLEGIGLKFE